MIQKLFGGKSNGFYLEADEDENNQSTSTEVEKTTTTEETAAPEPVKEKSAKKSTKTSIKDRKKTATKTAPTSIPVSASSNGASSPLSGDQPSWVKAMYKKESSSNGNAGGGEQTFATDNLLPTPSTYRRRPGPSLNKFKEMARQAKIRRR